MRPGQIGQVLAVDFARPRPADLVLDPAFIALKRDIMGLLRADQDDDEDH